MGCRFFTGFLSDMAQWTVELADAALQRRLILLRCVSSFSPQTELIDLTTVRVAALPLSRLEGWFTRNFLLTTSRVRHNRALSANASIHSKNIKFCFGFSFPCPDRAPGERSGTKREPARPRFDFIARFCFCCRVMAWFRSIS